MPESLSTYDALITDTALMSKFLFDLIYNYQRENDEKQQLIELERSDKDAHNDVGTTDINTSVRLHPVPEAHPRNVEKTTTKLA